MTSTFSPQYSKPHAATPTSPTTSAVPERFRSVTKAHPGQSAVPGHFRSVTQPTRSSAKPKTR